MSLGERLYLALEELAGLLSLPDVNELATRLPAMPNPDRAEAEGFLSWIPKRRFSSAAESMLLGWREQPDLPGSALAAALQAMVRTRHNLLEERATRLLWSGPDSRDFKPLRMEQTLIGLAKSAERTIWAATFSSGDASAVQKAMIQAADGGVRVRIILELAEHNSLLKQDAAGFWLSSGRFEVWHWPKDRRPNESSSQHAKFMLVDDRRLVISSANLTKGGLAWNMELGAEIHGPLARDFGRHLDALARSGALQRVGAPRSQTLKLTPSPSRSLHAQQASCAGAEPKEPGSPTTDGASERDHAPDPQVLQGATKPLRARPEEARTKAWWWPFGRRRDRKD